MDIQLDVILKNIYKKDFQFNISLLNKIEFKNYSEESEAYIKLKNLMVQKGIAFLSLISSTMGSSDNPNVENIILNMADVVKASNSKEYIEIDMDEEEEEA